MIHSQDIAASSVAELLLTWAITFGDINAMRLTLSAADPVGGGVPASGAGHAAVLRQTLPGILAKDCRARRGVTNITVAQQWPGPPATPGEGFCHEAPRPAQRLLWCLCLGA